MGDGPKYCEICLKAAEQWGEEKDCTSCEAKCPDLLPENKLAWELWLLSSTQWRVGFSLVGLDWPAVIEIAKIHGIRITPAIFNKIKALEHYELKRYNTKEEGDE